MGNQIIGTNEDSENKIEIDSWEAAFAALDKTNEENNQNVSTSSDNGENGSDSDSSNDNRNESIPDNIEDRNSNKDSGNTGGYDSLAGSNDSENRTAFDGMLGVTEESIRQYEQDLDTNIRDRAIEEVAQEFIKRGIRNNNGVLGATLDDADICKRDDDGVPRFFNPETGREFTGDNPRRQDQ